MFENERKREIEKAVQAAELEEKHEKVLNKQMSILIVLNFIL